MLDKAKKILTENKIKKTSKGFYQVTGQSGIHNIIINGSKVCCTCSFYSVQGCANHRVCSHIMAAIGYEMRGIWDKKTEFIASFK